MQLLKKSSCKEARFLVTAETKTNLNIFGWKPLPSYYNYRIFFRFLLNMICTSVDYSIIIPLIQLMVNDWLL